MPAGITPTCLDYLVFRCVRPGLIFDESIKSAIAADAIYEFTARGGGDDEPILIDRLHHILPAIEPGRAVCPRIDRPAAARTGEVFLVQNPHACGSGGPAKD